MGSPFIDRARQRANIYYSLIDKFTKGGIEDKKILDLGCLEGGISLFLATKGAVCTGIDVREAHLKSKIRLNMS